MANTQINITDNGTTTLATSGKYCDRNIDVNVDVSGKPTQFTNLYDPANVTLKKVFSYSSSSGASITTDNYVNYIIIPYHHKANDPVALRVRGISMPVRDRQGFAMYEADGETAVTWGQIATATTRTMDEYGDMVLTFGKTSTFVTKEWDYLHLNFQYIGVNSSAPTAYDGAIITINEPIGNGGFVE